MNALISFIPLPGRIMLLAAFAVALWGHGYVNGIYHEEAKFDAYVLKQQKAVDAQAARAARVTQGLKDDAATIKGAKDAEIKSIADKLAAALGRLRERPDRGPVSPTTAAACAGVSGAQLARGDGEFLERYAADAAILASAVKQCEVQYGVAKSAIDKFTAEGATPSR